MRIKTLSNSLLLYILIVIFFFSNFFLRLLTLKQNQRIILGNGGDSYQFIWNIFHVREFLRGKDELFYSKYLGFPVGRELYWYTLSPFNSFFGAFLMEAFSLTYENAYNFLILFHFAFSAFSMFIFLNFLTKNRLASFVGGFLYGFSPWNYARALGHLNLLSTGTIPLFLYLIFKLKNELQRASFDGNKVLSHTILSAILLVTIGLSELQYFFYLCLFLLIFVAFFFLRSKKKLNFLLTFGIILFLSLILFGLIYLPSLKFYKIKSESLKVEPQYFMGPLNFLFPSPFGLFSLLKERLTFIYLKLSGPTLFSGDESINSIYFTAFLFFLFMIIKCLLTYHNKRIFHKFLRSETIFWILIFGVFYFLSLDNFFSRWLHLLPLINFINVMSRLSFVSYLSFCVIFSSLFTSFLRKVKNKKILPIFLGFLLIEAYPINFPLTVITIPSDLGKIYKLSENTTVLVVPYTTVAFYLQAYHGKRLINTIATRATPLEEFGVSLLEGNESKVEENIKAVGLSAIIFHERFKFKEDRLMNIYRNMEEKSLIKKLNILVVVYKDEIIWPVYSF